MTETNPPADDRPGVTPHRLTAELLAVSPADPAERRTRYASAMARRDGDTWPTAYVGDEADYLRRADAAIAVADAEQAELRVEVTRLGDWCRTVTTRATDAEAALDRVHGELAVNEADRVAAVRRAEKTESAVTRVRRLHDRLATETELASPEDRITRADAAERIADALDMQSASGPGRADGKPQQDETQAAPFFPSAHYRGRDGTAYCVHAVPVGPNSCRGCRDLGEQPAAVSQPGKDETP